LRSGLGVHVQLQRLGDGVSAIEIRDRDKTGQDKTSAWTWMLDRSQTRDGELVLCAYAGIKVKVKIQPVDGHARNEI
jgi:hypothetical protein